LSKNTAGYESYNSNWEYKFFNFYNKLYMWAPNNKLIIFNNILLLPGTCVLHVLLNYIVVFRVPLLLHVITFLITILFFFKKTYIITVV